MGSFLNQVTQPFGVKMFSGGPYADGGAGDRAQATNDQQMALAEKSKAEQMALAQQFMAQLAPIIAQVSQASGVGNPLTPGDQGQFSNDPYGLSPLQQASSNQQAGVTSDAYDNIMSKVKANLSARGMANSSTMTAAEVYLKKQLQSDLGSQRIQAGQNAYGNRMSALDQIGGMLGQGYGAQQNALTGGTAGVQDVLSQRQGITAQQGQTAQMAQQQAMQNLGQMIGLGTFLGGVGRQKPQMGGQAGQQQAWPNGMSPQQQFDSTPKQFGNINWSSIYGG